MIFYLISNHSLNECSLIKDLLFFKILKVRRKSLVVHIRFILTYWEIRLKNYFTSLMKNLGFNIQRLETIDLEENESFSLKSRRNFIWKFQKKKWMEGLSFVWCILKISSEGKDPQGYLKIMKQEFSFVLRLRVI